MLTWSIRRQLYTTEAGCREAVPKLCLWNGRYCFTLLSALSSDVLISQFKYINDRKALWSGDYVRGRDPRIIPYDDANEDQNVKVEDILKFDVSDEPIVDHWVYDGHSIDDIPNYGNVEPPLKDMCVHYFVWRASYPTF